MKLKYTKNQEGEILVVRGTAEDDEQFSYVEMIKGLIQGDILEDPEFIGEFSEEEEQSLMRMHKQINATCHDPEDDQAEHVEV